LAAVRRSETSEAVEGRHPPIAAPGDRAHDAFHSSMHDLPL
jgi:hypothetical protein